MRKTFMLSLSLLLLFPFAQVSKAAYEGKEPSLIALKFYADWCGTCQEMGPLLKNLSQILDEEDVLFHQLDFTTSADTRQSELLIGVLGLSNILNDNQGKGFILLVDPQSNEVVDRQSGKPYPQARTPYQLAFTNS